MKQCNDCGLNKQETDFNKNRTKKDGLQTYCRDCGKDRHKTYHREHRKEHSEVCARRAKQVRSLNKERIEKYLNCHPCVDCGETDIVVLDFDHIRGEKFLNISQMVNQGYSWKTIKEEINKCDVRCANDHRRRHANELRMRVAA
jgi:hypothetical protein